MTAKRQLTIVVLYEGKSIVLVDDSIVRGTTSGQLIKLLKDNGAKDVHIRIASPPLHYPCYMGINIPTKEELIANHLNANQLAESLGAASLVYLSIEGLKVTTVISELHDNHLYCLLRRCRCKPESKRNKHRKESTSRLDIVWRV